MFDRPAIRLLPAFGLISAVLISPRLAHAQPTGGDTAWAVVDVVSALNHTIADGKGSVELREKVVRRFSECSLMYGAASRLASNPEAKKNLFQSQAATAEVESKVSEPLPLEKRREIEEAAVKSVEKMTDTLKKHGEKELVPFLKSCKSLNEVKEISNAVRELSLQ